MLIEFDKAYDLENTLRSGQAFRWCPPDADGWLTGVIFDNIVRIRRVHEGVEFVCGPNDESALQPRIVDYLRLSDDLDSIKASINRDDCIGAIIAQSPGLHILRQDPWECIISFICSPRTSICRVRKHVNDIADKFGSPLALGELRRNTFPLPAALAEAGEDRLLSLVLGRSPERVAKAVAKAAEWVEEGEVDIDALREKSYDDALKALIKFYGIGDKVGNCTLLYALDKLYAFPVDGNIARALRGCYPEVPEMAAGKLNDKKVRQMRQWAQSYFGEYAGYAQHWLFYNERVKSKGV